MLSKHRIAATIVAGLLALSDVPSVHAGGLTHVGMAPATTPANHEDFVLVSPDGGFVYASDDITGGSIAVFSRNASTGALTSVQSVCYPDCFTSVTQFRAMTISADGAHLYATAYDADNDIPLVLAYGRNAGTGALTFLEAQQDGAASVDGLQGPAGIAISADGKSVYAVGENDDAVALFSRNTSTGHLTFVQAYFNSILGGDALHDPAEPVLSPDAHHVYVVGSRNVTVFSRNTTTGQLTLAQVVDESSASIGNAKHLTVSPDGSQVYVAANGVNTYGRNTTTGVLTFVDRIDLGDLNLDGGSIGVLTVQPDGTYAYGGGSTGVVAFRRNATSGMLSYVAAVPPGNHNDSLTVSPDGHYLYTDNGVDIYAIDRCGNSVVGPDEHCDDGNTTNGDGCSSTCQLELCGPTPSGTCRDPIAPGKSQLFLRHATPITHELARWSWSKGEATTATEFGNPVTTASYVLCVYDSSGSPQPLLNLAALAGGLCDGRPCWSATSTHGFKYKDRFMTPNGWSTILLREGLTDGKARISFKGKGLFLGLPPTPLTFPVTVQVKNTQTNVCWEAVYTSPVINTTAQLKALSN